MIRDPVEQYNAALGNRLGRPIVNVPRTRYGYKPGQKVTTEQHAANMEARHRSRYSAARSGMPSVKAATRKIAQAGGGGVGGSSAAYHAAGNAHAIFAQCRVAENIQCIRREARHS